MVGGAPDDLQAVMRRVQGVQNRLAVIGRSIVDDDTFDFRVGLVEDRGNGLSQQMAIIVVDNDDAHQGQLEQEFGCGVEPVLRPMHEVHRDISKRSQLRVLHQSLARLRSGLEIEAGTAYSASWADFSIRRPHPRKLSRQERDARIYVNISAHSAPVHRDLGPKLTSKFTLWKQGLKRRDAGCDRAKRMPVRGLEDPNIS